MKIIVDTREQRPYKFKDSQVGTLACGDYSLAGAEHLIAVERKELGDLINCLSHDRVRFEKELFKGKSLDYMALVAEATLADIVNHNYRSQMQPTAAIQSLIAFSVRYKLPVWFTGNREYGARVTESLLTKYAAEVEKKFKTIQN